MTRRKEILRFIRRYAKENKGVTPSARSIAAAFRLGKTTVLTHIGPYAKACLQSRTKPVYCGP